MNAILDSGNPIKPGGNSTAVTAGAGHTGGGMAGESSLGGADYDEALLELDDEPLLICDPREVVVHSEKELSVLVTYNQLEHVSRISAVLYPIVVII